jgi:DNA-binding NarL/FixJ family response regulator
MSTPAPAPRRSAGLPIHVVLVDDHPAVRHGIRELIGTQADLVTIAEAGSASQATADLARWADVAVIDYHLGGRDGLWLTQEIKQRPSPPPVLLYSAFADVPLAAAAIVAGADGVLNKSVLADEVTIAIRRLFHGRHYLPAIPDATVAALSARLNPRDRAIFAMLIDGLGRPEVVSRLGITFAELKARRRIIVRALMPAVARPRLPDPTRAPLEYERRVRRPRFPASR